MKKKGTQTVENTTEDELKRLKMNRSHGRGTEADGGGKKRAKGGEEVLGMDRQRARTPRRRRTTLTVEARHRRRSHAPTRARTRWRVGGKLPEKTRA